MTWRRARRADLALAVLWALAAAITLAARPLLPGIAAALPPCPLHALTGVPCFACGSTRALLALTHGDWAHALALHPLAAAAATLGVAAGLVAPLWAASGAPLPSLGDSAPRWRVAAWIVLAAQWGYLIAVGR